VRESSHIESYQQDMEEEEISIPEEKCIRPIVTR
jgi:hypothetical protein